MFTIVLRSIHRSKEKQIYIEQKIDSLYLEFDNCEQKISLGLYNLIKLRSN